MTPSSFFLPRSHARFDQSFGAQDSVAAVFDCFADSSLAKPVLGVCAPRSLTWSTAAPACTSASTADTHVAWSSVAICSAVWPTEFAYDTAVDPGLENVLDRHDVVPLRSSEQGVLLPLEDLDHLRFSILAGLRQSHLSKHASKPL